MVIKYTIRTAADLQKAINSCLQAGEFTSNERVGAILNKATYEVLKKFVWENLLFPKHITSLKEEEKRKHLICDILSLYSDLISYEYGKAEYLKDLASKELEEDEEVPETSFENVTDAETAIKALAKAETREEMKCILESLSYEELEKVEKGSFAEFVKKTNLINLIISYVEYSKSVNK